MRQLRPSDLRSLQEQFGRDRLFEMAILSYLHWNPFMRWLMWRRLLVAERLGHELTPGLAVDFGTGLGVMLPTLSRLADHVLALDRDLAPASVLSRKLGLDNVSFVFVKDSRIALPDCCADLVVSLDVLEHFEDLPEIAREMARIVKPGGYLLISGPSENIPYRIGRFLAGFQGRSLHKGNVDDVHQALAREFRLRRRRQLLPLVRLFDISLFQRHGAEGGRGTNVGH